MGDGTSRVGKQATSQMTDSTITPTGSTRYCSRYMIELTRLSTVVTHSDG
jgi:hypothetical protein